MTGPVWPSRTVERLTTVVIGRTVASCLSQFVQTRYIILIEIQIQVQVQAQVEIQAQVQVQVQAWVQAQVQAQVHVRARVQVQAQVQIQARAQVQVQVHTDRRNDLFYTKASSTQETTQGQLRSGKGIPCVYLNASVHNRRHADVTGLLNAPCSSAAGECRVNTVTKSVTASLPRVWMISGSDTHYWNTRVPPGKCLSLCVWTGLSCNTTGHTLRMVYWLLIATWLYVYSVNRALSPEFQISMLLKTVVPCKQVPNLFWHFIIQTSKCTTHIYIYIYIYKIFCIP